MIEIALILVHFNAEAETRACLTSLKDIKTKDLKVSVIVLDNGSKEVLSISPKAMPANTVILRSDSNLGFPQGNNLAIEHALKHGQPTYIVLLNNDTIVDSKFLQELVKTAQSHPTAGMVSPKIYFAPGREFFPESYTKEQKGNVIWYAGGGVDWANLDAFHHGVDELDRGQFDRQVISDFATGCCVLIPTAVLGRVGLLDPRYFLYLEDVDLSLRIREAGYDLVFSPNAKIWHVNAGSSGGAGSPLHTYYQTRNRLFFFLKYAHLCPWFVTPHTLRQRVTFFAQKIWYQFFVLRFAVRLLFNKEAMIQRGVLDFALGKMDKQSVF